MTVEIEIRGDKDVERLIQQKREDHKRGMSRATRNNAFFLRDLVRQNATHRPGPIVHTKEYWNSIRVEQLESEDGVSSYAVLTNHPAADRLEYGFVATDSAGRHYAQPPYAHWRPAIPVAQAAYRADLEKL